MSDATNPRHLSVRDLVRRIPESDRRLREIDSLMEALEKVEASSVSIPARDMLRKMIRELFWEGVARVVELLQAEAFGEQQ
jgi:hypothetical protein